MFNTFDDKLYTQYYPLKTEEEKNEFLNFNSTEILVHKMLTDRRVKNITDNLQNLDSLACKLMYHEYGNITVDELNYVLKLKNFSKHKMWRMCLLLLILLIVCVCIFL